MGGIGWPYEATVFVHAQGSPGSWVGARALGTTPEESGRGFPVGGRGGRAAARVPVLSPEAAGATGAGTGRETLCCRMDAVSLHAVQPSGGGVWWRRWWWLGDNREREEGVVVVALPLKSVLFHDTHGMASGLTARRKRPHN